MSWTIQSRATEDLGFSYKNDSKGTRYRTLGSVTCMRFSVFLLKKKGGRGQGMRDK